MAKTKTELKKIKARYNKIEKELDALSDDELDQVVGGYELLDFKDILGTSNGTCPEGYFSLRGKCVREILNCPGRR